MFMIYRKQTVVKSEVEVKTEPADSFDGMMWDIIAYLVMSSSHHFVNMKNGIF